MSQTTPYAGSLSPTEADLEALIGALLEGETPLSTLALARLILVQRVEQAKAALAARFADTVPYNPRSAYRVGQKLVFTAEDLKVGTVIDIRDGDNTAWYGAYRIIRVQTDDGEQDYAAELTAPHALSTEAALPVASPEQFDVEAILNEHADAISDELDAALTARPDLVRLAGEWFPRELIMGVNQGHINLADAVLDINGGSPLSPAEILEQIGGLGSGTPALQAFSLNYALNQDPRFDEVGPSGQVLWILKHYEPTEVRDKPAALRYAPPQFDLRLVGEDDRAVEAEIDDEYSDLPTQRVTVGKVRLIYPHRRVGTLPLNSQTRAVFPTARRAPRIYITLVDATDGQTFNGWVVPDERYVYGLLPFYEKHKVPLGALLTAKRDTQPGRIVIGFDGPLRAHVEHLNILSVNPEQQPMLTMNTRSIGAPFDLLMLFGIDELKPVEALAQSLNQSRKGLVAILRMLIPPLARLSPQNAVHFKTLYAVINVFRRTAPDLLAATLNGNADFDNPVGQLWKLSDL